MDINQIQNELCALHDKYVGVAINRSAELLHMGMENARQNPRKNDVWDIVFAVPVDNRTEIVIGDRHTDFEPYVAWHCFDGDAFSWGHYCQNFGDAFECALNKIRKELGLD